VKTGAANRLLFMFGRAGEDEQVEIAAGMAEFWRYCEALAEDRRAHPRDDFTSDLVHTPDRDGKPLTQQEVATILFGLLLAGHETTTNLLGHAVRRLLEHRESWEALCADPTLIPGAVEEVLRYDSSVIHWRRRTTRPVELSGVELPEGADVLVSIGAANRDPEVFADPDRFDIRRREASEHLSFGNGPHYCLGAPARPAGGARRAGGAHRRAAEPAARARPGLHVPPDHRLPRPYLGAGRVGKLAVSRGSADAIFAPRWPLAALSGSSSTPGTRAALRLARSHLDHEAHRP
jgi:hypothetical protein